MKFLFSCFIVLIGSVFSAFVSCNDGLSSSPEYFTTDTVETALDEYWYQGKAEISRFELQQARYGEIHKGDAIMVFVTEDFRTDIQVKLENEANKDKAINVMKLNFMRNFPTGIYDYSALTSVFTPANGDKNSKCLKVTNSVQEWCGHVFTQLNWTEGKKYDVKSFSYFEADGDKTFELKTPYLEDEIWNIIRMNPNNLPLGRIEIVTSTLYSRLGHWSLRPMDADALLSVYEGEDFEGEELMEYVLIYPEHNRTLKIVYENVSPYKIQGFQEIYKAPFWAGGELLTTTAKRTHTILSDYWDKHSLEDRVLRRELGLEE
ncbi:MAG: hypothetical protein R3E32_29085 [Chitinophagales bacterium]